MARRKIDLDNDNKVMKKYSLVEQPISQARQQQVSRDIIDERLQLKNTAIMDMIGTLTKVTWLHIVSNNKENNYSIDTNPLNDIASDNKKFDVYREFQIKLQGKVEHSEDGDVETVRSFITNGSALVLPRTIKPYENDLFIMQYLDKLNIYRITGVEVQTLESDPGFVCSFTQYKTEQYLSEDDFIKTLHVNNDYFFHPENVGSSYRTILTYSEDELLWKFRKLYTEIGKIFINACFDRTYNTYFLNYEGEQRHAIMDINNMRVKPIPKPNEHNFGYTGLRYNDVAVESYPLSIYDNMLCQFIKKNSIFKNIENRIYTPDVLLPLRPEVYMRSIFSALEERTKLRLKNVNTKVSAIKVQTPGMSSLLIGRYDVTHEEFSGSSVQLLSPILLDLIISNPKSLSTPFSEKSYDNYSSVIAEIIAIYVLKISSNLDEHLMSLYDNLDKLFPDNIKSENIFYLYPLLGYVISKTLETKLTDGTVQER